MDCVSPKGLYLPYQYLTLNKWRYLSVFKNPVFYEYEYRLGLVSQTPENKHK